MMIMMMMRIVIKIMTRNLDENDKSVAESESPGDCKDYRNITVRCRWCGKSH